MSFTPPCPGTYGAGPLLVQAPAVRPYPYSAISAYTVLDETDDHARNGIVYKSPACQADINEFVDDCNSANIAPKTATDANRDSTVRGCPFHLYAKTSCKTTTLEAMYDEANLIFDLGENRGIEAAVWSNVLAQPTATILNTVPGVAGALGMAAAIGALESAMACCYPGLATLHADRGLSVFAGNVFQLIQARGQLLTPLGTQWAFYGCAPNTGPDGVVAPAGTGWVYATSQLTLRRFPKMVNPDHDHILNYPTNEPAIVVERTYVPSIECCTFAILVTASCACS